MTLSRWTTGAATTSVLVNAPMSGGTRVAGASPALGPRIAHSKVAVPVAGRMISVRRYQM